MRDKSRSRIHLSQLTLDSLFREAWKPLFEMNIGGEGEYMVYVNRTINALAAAHPSWSTDRLWASARDEYNAGARALMTETMRVARSLRPHMIWGYYSRPLNCFPPGSPCSRKEQQQNDELGWLWSAVTGLFPELYLSSADAAVNQRAVDADMAEAMRVAGTTSLPVYPFTTYLLSHAETFLGEQDARSEFVRISEKWGAAGAVIWGGSNDKQENYTRCSGPGGVAAWVRARGPALASAVQDAATCSARRCSGHGRCAGSAAPQRCQCYPGYAGAACAGLTM